MKKFLPIVVFFASFTFFVLGHVVSNILYPNNLSGHNTLLGNYLYSKKNDKIPLIKVKGIDGKIFDLTKLGAPIVMFNFWASWCSPCLNEMPTLVKLKGKFKDSELMIFGFNWEESISLDKIKKVAAKFKINFPLVIDEDGSIWDMFSVMNIPMTIIFFKGERIKSIEGGKDFSSIEFQEEIEKLLAKSRANSN